MDRITPHSTIKPTENPTTPMIKPPHLIALIRAGAALALILIPVSHVAAADASTAPQPTATISGRVKNAATNQYLNKA